MSNYSFHAVFESRIKFPPSFRKRDVQRLDRYRYRYLWRLRSGNQILSIISPQAKKSVAEAVRSV